MKTYRLLQQREKCIGCNACMEAAPYRWRMSKSDGKCTLVGGIQKRDFYSVVIDETELEDNLLAIKNCPVHIIQIVELVKKG
ncbi:MAG: hypothetical protein RL264_1293 [Bacteroidota bacterium]|jgi:ferredoxin